MKCYFIRLRDTVAFGMQHTALPDGIPKYRSTNQISFY